MTGRPVRLLVVEDSESDCRLLLRHLQREGLAPLHHRVDTRAALAQALRQERWDAVLCDYAVPGFGAPDALRMVRRSGLDLPFIVVSGAISDGIAAAMMREGAHDYVLKGNLTRLAPAVRRELREAAERQRRRRAEQERQESQERHRRFIALSTEGVARITLDRPVATWLPEEEQAELLLTGARVLESNDAFARHYGYQRAPEVEGQCIADLRKAPRADVLAACLAFVRAGYGVNDHEISVPAVGEARVWLLRTIVGKVEQEELVGAWIVQRDITARRAAEHELLAYQDRLRSLASEVARAEERERRRLADELHDSVAQTLAMLRVRLGLLADRREAGDELAAVEELAATAVQQTRAVMLQLSPTGTYQSGLAQAVEGLAEQLRRQYGLTVTCHDDGSGEVADDDLRAVLFQATRELLVNAAKHAQAEAAHVSLGSDGECVRITVTDAGRGFDPAEAAARADGGETFGLFSIRERLRQWPGGRMEIASQPGRGTRVALFARQATADSPDGAEVQGEHQDSAGR